MYKAIVSFCLLIVMLFSGAQAQDEGTMVRKRLLVGQWKLVRHTVNLDMPGPYQEETDLMRPGYLFTYTFHADGTYQDETNNGIPNLPNYRHSGNWELTEGGTVLKLTHIHEIPGVLNTELPDLELPLLRLTETELQLPELLFSDAEKPGTSFYRKQIPETPQP